ncbi:uncharacterized protein LOC144520878 isoform X1 [Sander vitreus]
MSRPVAEWALRSLLAMSINNTQTCARPLSEHSAAWIRLTHMDSWMSKLITRGYTLQFASPPPRFTGVLETTVLSQAESDAMMTELGELLSKGAISRVPPGEENEGFYSRYFLTPKKSGGLRPILDLSQFNWCIMERPFHMLTVRHVLECSRHHEWFTSVDLKDAYCHIQIIHRHRKFLRFFFPRGPFPVQPAAVRDSLFPSAWRRPFSCCGEKASESCFYLDDLLILAPFREKAALHTMEVLRHLQTLGFAINWQKSSLVPAQSIVYLGVDINSIVMRARLSAPRRDALISLLSRTTLHATVSPLSVMRLLGMMSAGSRSCPPGSPPHEENPEVVSSPAPQPHTPQVATAEHPSFSSVRPGILGKPSDPVKRGSPGQGDVIRDSVHRHVPYWLGRDVRATGGGRRMATSHSPTHKLPGAVHGADGFKALRPSGSGETCCRTDRQRYSSSVHKPLTRRALGPAIGNSQEPPAVGP